MERPQLAAHYPLHKEQQFPSSPASSHSSAGSSPKASPMQNLKVPSLSVLKLAGDREHPSSVPSSPNDGIRPPNYVLRSSSSADPERPEMGTSQSPSPLTLPPNNHSKVEERTLKNATRATLFRSTSSPISPTHPNHHLYNEATSTLTSEKTPNQPFETDKLPLKVPSSPKFAPPLQDWIHCFCEVRFDLETGQGMSFYR